MAAELAPRALAQSRSDSIAIPILPSLQLGIGIPENTQAALAKISIRVKLASAIYNNISIIADGLACFRAGRNAGGAGMVRPLFGN